MSVPDGSDGLVASEALSGMYRRNNGNSGAHHHVVFLVLRSWS